MSPDTPSWMPERAEQVKKLLDRLAHRPPYKVAPADQRERMRDVQTFNADEIVELLDAVEDMYTHLTRDRPEVICLCGSTRFWQTYHDVGWELTLQGKIVFAVGVCKHAEDHGGEALGQDVADALDELHLRKIDRSDKVLVLNVGGYVGESTAKEIVYAHQTGKPVTFLEPEKTPYHDFNTLGYCEHCQCEIIGRKYGCCPELVGKNPPISDKKALDIAPGVS